VGAAPVTYRIKVAKPVVILTLLFIFALGMEFGFLLHFQEAVHRSQLIRQSLEETAKWEP